MSYVNRSGNILRCNHCGHPLWYNYVSARFFCPKCRREYNISVKGIPSRVSSMPRRASSIPKDGFIGSFSTLKGNINKKEKKYVKKIS